MGSKKELYGPLGTLCSPIFPRWWVKCLQGIPVNGWPIGRLQLETNHVVASLVSFPGFNNWQRRLIWGGALGAYTNPNLANTNSTFMVLTEIPCKISRGGIKNSILATWKTTFKISIKFEYMYKKEGRGKSIEQWICFHILKNNQKTFK